MARRIVITSGKGGVGKTTVTANLGASLARLGSKVVVMDTDIGLNNLDVVLGLEHKIVYDLADVINNKCRPRQALIQDERLPNLYVMPSCHAYDGANINGQNIKYVVDLLSETCDYVLLDCPAGIELGFHRSVAAADEALVVTTPHISALRDADKVLALLKAYRLSYTGIIVNRARGDLILEKDMIGIENIEQLLKAEIAGVVPDDDEVTASASVGRFIPQSSRIGKAFEFLAASLASGEKRVWDCTETYRGFFGKIKRSLKRKI